MTKCLVITGGSKGIGKKTAGLFIEKGWKVINIARTACDINDVVNFSIDLSSSANIEKNAKDLQAAVKDSSAITLVHNAGFSEKDKVDNLFLDTLRRSFETSIISSVALNQVFVPVMSHGSSIVYISSILGTKAVPNHATYIMTKHAMIGLMKATCHDLGDKDIRSYCICPGLVDTERLKKTMTQEEIAFVLTNKVIGKRLIEPTEIAEIIYFCAISPVMNGAVIEAALGHK